MIDLSLVFYLFNAHGDVTQRVDAAGNTLVKYDYDAFGNRRGEPDADTLPLDGLEIDLNPFRYCGEYWDVDTEELYLRARTYGPGNGRFTSEDPAKSGMNWYVYALSNPLKYTDPSGLREPDIWLGDIDQQGNKKGSVGYRRSPGSSWYIQHLSPPTLPQQPAELVPLSLQSTTIPPPITNIKFAWQNCLTPGTI